MNQNHDKQVTKYLAQKRLGKENIMVNYVYVTVGCIIIILTTYSVTNACKTSAKLFGGRLVNFCGNSGVLNHYNITKNSFEKYEDVVMHINICTYTIFCRW